MTSQQAPKVKRGGRPRAERIEVCLTAAEAAAVARMADQVGMSRSAYLRAVGLNQPVRSMVDQRAVADLTRVNGDLGRVAGLLKLWLLEKRGQGARPRDVETLIHDFRELQAQLLGLMGKVVRDR